MSEEDMIDDLRQEVSSVESQTSGLAGQVAQAVGNETTGGAVSAGSRIGGFFKGAGRFVGKGLGFGVGYGVGQGIIQKMPPFPYFVLFIFAFVMSLVNFFSGNAVVRLIFYALYGFAIHIFFKDNVSDHWYRSVMFLVVLGIFGADIGNLVVQMPFPSTVMQLLLFFITIFGYFGPLIILMSVHVKDNFLTALLKLSLFIAFLIMVLYFLTTLGLLPSVSDMSGDQRDEINSLFLNMWTFTTTDIPAYVRGTYNQTRTQFEDDFARIQGTYEEDVDAEAGVSALGLQLTNLEMSNRNRAYFQGDAVTAWAGLEARSVGRTIDATISCLVDRRDGPELMKRGSLNVNSLSIDSIDYRDIVCTFPAHTFDRVNNHQLEILAHFNFTTNAYVRRYFMDQEEHSVLRQNGVDPMRFFNIPSELQSVFTNGPVSLTVAKREILDPISNGKDFVLGIQVDVNRRSSYRDGKIRDIQSLTFSLPPGFVLQRQGGQYSCGGFPVKQYSENDCIADCRIQGKGDRCEQDCRNFNSYALDLTQNRGGLSFSQERSGDRYLQVPFTIPCSVEVSSVRQILGDSQIGIANFRASIDYTFEVSEVTTFSVQRREGYVNQNLEQEFLGLTTFYMHPGVVIDVDRVNQFYERALPTVEQADPYLANSVLPHALMQGVIAYANRNGPANNIGLGFTGITSAKLREVGLEWQGETGSDVGFTSIYLQHKMDNECSAQFDGVENLIDCALAHMFCDTAGGTCEENVVPIILALAEKFT
ncbi:MAG: hypothetical protein ACMXYK_00415 [Candidatus Woesearchaeota archaeon]